jgi:hypothetical protein
MNSRRYTNALSVFNGLVIALECGNDQHVTVVACDCLAQRSSPHPVFALWVSLESVEVPLQVSEGVGVAVSKVNGVFVMLELALPGESVVISLVFPLHAVLIVTYVIACSNPASACLLSLRLGVHQGAHTVVVEGVWLDKVDDVEAVVLACLGV